MDLHTKILEAMFAPRVAASEQTMRAARMAAVRPVFVRMLEVVVAVFQVETTSVPEADSRRSQTQPEAESSQNSIFAADTASPAFGSLAQKVAADRIAAASTGIGPSTHIAAGT